MKFPLISIYTLSNIIYHFSNIILIEQIKSQLAQSIDLQSKKGVFFSAFDAQGQLLASNWVIKTDRTLENILQSFYNGILKKIEPQTKSIIFDIVEEIRQQNDPNTLKTIPLDQYWLFVVEWNGQNSWVLLPNTQWATRIQDAVKAIKQKYNLNGQVSFWVFKTKKILIQL